MTDATPVADPLRGLYNEVLRFAGQLHRVGFDPTYGGLRDAIAVALTASEALASLRELLTDVTRSGHEAITAGHRETAASLVRAIDEVSR